MDYPPLSAEEQADVNREWEAYWCALLAPNGALDVERVKREMYAFGMLADDVSKVYMAVTGDKVSKPGTDPDVVIGLAKEHSETLAEAACEAALAARREEAEEAADMLREILAEIGDMLPAPDSPETPKSTGVLQRFQAWRKETIELVSRMRAGLDTTAYDEHDAATLWLRRMGR